MSSCWATRRASSTSLTLQQPVSLSPPHSFIVTPTTSWPCSSSSAPATDESTPPLIANITRIASPGRHVEASQAGDAVGQHVDGTVDVVGGGRVAEAHPQRTARPALVDTHRR